MHPHFLFPIYVYLFIIILIFLYMKIIHSMKSKTGLLWCSNLYYLSILKIINIRVEDHSSTPTFIDDDCC
nr:MAG TPA: hypothetical protein [Caudoviricetes sp.]